MCLLRLLLLSGTLLLLGKQQSWATQPPFAASGTVVISEDVSLESPVVVEWSLAVRGGGPKRTSLDCGGNKAFILL